MRTPSNIIDRQWLAALASGLALAACELTPLLPPPGDLVLTGTGGATGKGGDSAGGSELEGGRSEGGSGGTCGNVELPCNGIDDDCSAATPDQPAVDGDGDGVTICGDCDDGDPAIHPGANDACGDGIDQDCDGQDATCAICGDHIVEGDEVCDDGNTTSGDGCRADCRGLEQCGDGLLDYATEACDPPKDAACPGLCEACACLDQLGPWTFADVTTQRGIDHTHAYDDATGPPNKTVHWISGGMAAADYDNDGFTDLYAVGGHLGTNTLWKNTGAGFVNVAAAAGVAATGLHGGGPTFADIDGDGDLDLFVGAFTASHLRLFHNNGDGSFTNITPTSGLAQNEYNFSGSFGDYDKDGDLDLAISHWGTFVSQQPCHLYRNDGGSVFTKACTATNIEVALAPANSRVYTFTPIFTDLDDDGWPDLLMSADFGKSRVLHNSAGTFTNATGPAITDENGMGSAVGDFDNDGDFDWFVSSIFDADPPSNSGWGSSGNRLYQNDGSGNFTDVTTSAGVREGGWGWGSCFADFNNDGWLDLLHVNGWYDVEPYKFLDDPSRLFINNGDGTFAERSVVLDLIDNGQGRGVACFDYDRDGDIDLAVFNNAGTLRLYENRLPRVRHYLTVTLGGTGMNTQAIGARITLEAGGLAQLREIRAGNSFESQSPALAHFGLGNAATVDTLTVRWPDGTETILTNVTVDQELRIVQP